MAQAERHSGHGNEAAFPTVSSRIVKDKLFSQHGNQRHDLWKNKKQWL